MNFLVIINIISRWKGSNARNALRKKVNDE